MQRNWSRQLKLRTLKSPRYCATKRRNVCHGANSITCANTSLPLCIAASPEIRGRLPASPVRIQIVNRGDRHEPRANSILFPSPPKICRTLVVTDHWLLMLLITNPCPSDPQLLDEIGLEARHHEAHQGHHRL